jgi:hypothetical protein
MNAAPEMPGWLASLGCVNSRPGYRKRYATHRKQRMVHLQLMRAYVFVDAENHFLRSEAAAEDIVGSSRAAEAFSIGARTVSGITCQRRPGIEPVWRGGWDWLPGFDGEIAAQSNYNWR